MVRPERPSRLYSTCADRSLAAARPPRRLPLDLGAECDLGLREPPAPDHGGAADAVPDRALGALLRQPLGQGALDLAGEEHRVADEHEEEREEQEARVAADHEVGGSGPDPRDPGHDEEEAAHVAAGVAHVEDEPLRWALVAAGKVG